MKDCAENFEWFACLGSDDGLVTVNRDAPAIASKLLQFYMSDDL